MKKQVGGRKPDQEVEIRKWTYFRSSWNIIWTRSPLCSSIVHTGWRSSRPERGVRIWKGSVPWTTSLMWDLENDYKLVQIIEKTFKKGRKIKKSSLWNIDLHLWGHRRRQNVAWTSRMAFARTEIHLWNHRQAATWKQSILLEYKSERTRQRLIFTICKTGSNSNNIYIWKANSEV